MRAKVTTRNGRANIYNDETGVHVRVIEANGAYWEAGFYPATGKDLEQAWANALALARQIVTPASPDALAG
jgi:hypothetical protein